jgi:hypothetical protein
MKSRTWAGAVVVVAALVAAYWYWSPVLAIRQMQSAAQTGDADAFNEQVDYPKLRESIKGQLAAMVTGAMATQQAPGNDFAKAGNALGMMLGMAMVDKMVDAFVRPEVVMRAMQEGKMSPKKNSSAESSAHGTAKADKDVVWTSERKGTDKYILSAAMTGEAPENRVSLVLERAGFASWKLTEVRLPSLK